MNHFIRFFLMLSLYSCASQKGNNLNQKLLFPNGIKRIYILPTSDFKDQGSLNIIQKYLEDSLKKIEFEVKSNLFLVSSTSNEKEISNILRGYSVENLYYGMDSQIKDIYSYNPDIFLLINFNSINGLSKNINCDLQIYKPKSVKVIRSFTQSTDINFLNGGNMELLMANKLFLELKFFLLTHKKNNNL